MGRIEIVRQRQFADLGVQRPHDRLRRLLRRRAESTLGLLQKLRAPLGNMIAMNVELLRQLDERFGRIAARATSALKA